MVRTITVTIAGLILSGLIAAAGTLFVLSHTQFGLLATGHSSGMVAPWQVFMSGSKALFLYVALPTVILVALFVGLLARRAVFAASAIAALPISILASGFDLQGLWLSLLLLFCCFVITALAGRLVRTRTSTVAVER
jgi:hypothetical protein